MHAASLHGARRGACNLRGPVVMEEDVLHYCLERIALS